uniref:Synaptotagmin X n=1 Tax=Cyprinus carpio TaxID=7962 RepID=A0A8C1JRF0_CYPCA
SFISFSYPRLLFPSPSVLHDLLNTLSFQSCLFFLCSLFLLLPVDISVSLLAVVVGFCGLALLVVSLFVFWKLCWPIWRSKAFLSNADSCPPGVLPEAPLSPARPPVSRSVSPHPEAKAIGTVGKQPSQIQHEDENDKKRKVPEVKVNGRSSVKILEAAMKISQTSPDIPAEVQQALHNHLSKQAKIQRQTTEPTSSSRMFMQIARHNVQQTCR